jgi:hypothetical protein
MIKFKILADFQHPQEFDFCVWQEGGHLTEAFE